MPCCHTATGARQAFGRFRVDDVETTYTIGTASADAGQRVGELIVRKFG